MSSRSTVTLEDDVFASLKAEMRRTGASFKQVINDVIRRGLSSPQPASPKEYRGLARDLKSRPGIDFACSGRLLTELDLLEWNDRRRR